MDLVRRGLEVSCDCSFIGHFFTNELAQRAAGDVGLVLTLTGNAGEMDDITVAMFTVANQDTAVAFYTGEARVREPMQAPGAPLLFMMRDPDGNNIAVVQSSGPTT